MTRELSLWRRVRRVARITRLAWHLASGVFVAHVVFVVLDRLPRTPGEQWRAALVRWWTKKLCRVMNLRIEIEGEMSTRPTLFVANHISWLDIPCLQAVLNASFVSKREVMNWPVFGALAARADTIFIARGGNKTTAAAADQMTWRLASRRSVVMFPEGTTTDGATLRPFHARLYQAAIRTHSPVQAIALRYLHNGDASHVAPFVDDDTLIPHLWRLLAQDQTTVQLTLCPIVEPTSNRRDLASATHAQIRTALNLDAPPQQHGLFPQIKANSRANLG